jgi:hypothetical protein
VNRLSLLVVTLLLTAGAVAVERAPHDPAAPARTTSAPVTGASVVCPDLRQQGDVLRTRVSAGVAGSDVAGPGSLLAQPLRGKGTPAPLPVDRPGQVAAGLGTDIDGDALVVTARGPLAAGLELEQVTRAVGGPNRGLAGLRCQPPSTDSWFVGGSTKVGDASLLVLANVDDAPAVVDVTVWTGAGPVDPRPGRGITVAARSRAAVALDTLAPDRDLLAVHVVVQRGRVASALRHARFDGRVPRGVEWVPPALPPAASVVVPGLPQGPGRRVVLVTNPGPDPTIVQLQLTTDEAQFVPRGLDGVVVPAATTVATDITLLTDGTPAAVRVSSDGGPVLAGAFVYDSQGTSQVKEFAYAGSTGPLVGGALLTDLVLDRPTESTLLLTAPAGEAVVTVTPVPVVGQSGPLPPAKQVTVPGGRTLALRLSTFLPPGASGRFAVEVRPVRAAPVYASRYLRERGDLGPLTTLLELRGAAQRVPLPAVVRDPAVGVSR